MHKKKYFTVVKSTDKLFSVPFILTKLFPSKEKQTHLRQDLKMKTLQSYTVSPSHYHAQPHSPPKKTHLQTHLFFDNRKTIGLNFFLLIYEG